VRFFVNKRDKALLRVAELVYAEYLQKLVLRPEQYQAYKATHGLALQNHLEAVRRIENQ